VIGAEPLTGRDSELGAIRRALSPAGNHAGVVIAGAAGVGKTWLAHEVLRRAEASGERTKWIVGTDSAQALPLGAFIGAMTEALNEAQSDPLTDVRRVINSFVAQQRQCRVLVGVDDAHLLDGLSALVVHQLAQSGGVRLVVTLRTGCDEPDAVTALWKDGLLERLDLKPLSAAATREVIESKLDAPVDARCATRFQKLTGGNALFLRQLLADQVAAGRMRKTAGVWMWDGDVAVSASLSDTVGRQMGALSPRVAMVIDTLSQCEPLAVEVVCDLARRSDLAAAERMGLVSIERTGAGLTARLAHPLFGELRRASAGELYLSEIRGRLATRLGDDGDADIQATVRRALLRLESDLDPDPALYLESARHAMTLLDLDLADRFATAAAQAGAPGAAGVRAMNLALLGRGEPAEAALRAMADGEVPDGHHWATVRAANLMWNLFNPTDAATILEGLAVGPESPAQRAERLAVQACLDAVAARCELAAENARAALDFPELPGFHTMMASLALIMAMGALGQVDELAGVADQVLRRATTSFQASHMRFWFGAVYGRACRLTGRIDEFVSTARQLADASRDIPGLAYANLASLAASAELARGAVAEAARLVHEAVAGVERHSVTTGLRPASYFTLAEAHAKLGQADEANEAVAGARSCVPADFLFMHTALSLAGGWAMAASGRLGDAVASVTEAARLARDRGQPTHELACVQAAAQWGDAAQAARARELADALPLPLAAAVASHAEALAAADGDGLLAASAAYRAIGDRVAAADAAAQASVVFDEGQHHRRGLYAAALARELADECGGLHTPALHTPTGLKLSGRQRDVVELVVAGLSNRDIAEKLVMSVRTVEGHVYRACQRVGAQSREELASIIRSGP
jgi:DNA-binding CsgD family transcriptional regulator